MTPAPVAARIHEVLEPFKRVADWHSGLDITAGSIIQSFAAWADAKAFDLTLGHCYAARALLRDLDTQGAAPAVWRPMPATQEMLDAAREWSRAKYGKPIGDDAARGCWNAMWSAAPAAPSPALHAPTVEACAHEADQWGYIGRQIGKSIRVLTSGAEAEPELDEGDYETSDKATLVRLIADRDRFIVSRDLWGDFADWTHTSGAEAGEREGRCETCGGPVWTKKEIETAEKEAAEMAAFFAKAEPADAGEVERRAWRVGRHFPIHIYEDDVPIATAQIAAYAKQIVADHNAAVRPAPTEEQVERARFQICGLVEDCNCFHSCKAEPIARAILAVGPGAGR